LARPPRDPIGPPSAGCIAGSDDRCSTSTFARCHRTDVGLGSTNGSIRAAKAHPDEGQNQAHGSAYSVHRSSTDQAAEAHKAETECDPGYIGPGRTLRGVGVPLLVRN
jgi:hypothetical protein